MLGIGAAHQKDPNGIAWKQNKDFESLLKRLNETTVQKTSGETGDEEIEVDVDGDKQKKRKRKGNGEDRSERMKKMKESKDHEESENLATQPLAIQWDKVIEGKAISAGVSKPVRSLPRHRAYAANLLVLS
jgi:Pin2-interacting protein X1